MSESLQDFSKSRLFKINGSTICMVEPFDTSAETVDLCGQLIDQKYKILRLLGQGGMGTVYLAHHQMLNKEVALKTFRSANLSAETKVRFQREAQALAKLSQPNIIQVFDFGMSDNLPYYTMEYLRGQSLAERLAAKGPLPVEQAIDIFTQVCRGLSVAHKKGIVHRDLKPANIFLEEGAGGALKAKLVDFGIASLTLPGENEEQKLTKIGAVFGSPLYMSPEQGLGYPVTLASDIYSLGCTLFEALVGAPPFRGANAFATITAHQKEPAPSLRAASGRDFSPTMERLVATMLAKTAEKRPADVDHVATQLRLAVGRGRNAVSEIQAASAQHEEPEVEELDLKARANIDSVKWFAIAAVSLIVLIIAGASLYYAQSSPLAVSQKKTNTASELKTVINAPKTNVGLTDISALLQNQGNDQKLNLRGQRLNAKVFDQIAQTAILTELNISDAGFENTDLKRLKRSTIKKISLTRSSFDDVGADCLAQCPNIDEIRASDTEVTDEGVLRLTSLPHLRRIQLAGDDVTDKSIEILNKKTGILEITLDKTKVSDKGLKEVNSNTLCILGLKDTSVSDAGVHHLAGMKELGTLRLDGSNVTTSSVVYLLKNCPKLETITLDRCRNISKEQRIQLKKTHPDKHFEE